MSPDQAPAGNGIARDTWVNLKRWLRKTTRNPFVMTISLLNPIIFLVLFTEVFGEITGGAISQSVGPGITYIEYLVPAIVIQVALIAATTSGIGLVEDIESGMFEKVLASPMHRGGVFLGKSLSEILRIIVQIAIVLGMGYFLLWLDSGASPGEYVDTGVFGVIGIVFVGVIFAVWFTAVSNITALITKDQESTIIAVNLLQFPLLFLSSAFLPLEVLPGWVQFVGRINPITYGVDAARALMLDRDVMTALDITAFGGIWDTLVPAIGILLILDIVLGALAVTVLNRSLRSEVQ